MCGEYIHDIFLDFTYETCYQDSTIFEGCSVYDDCRHCRIVDFQMLIAHDHHLRYFIFVEGNLDSSRAISVQLKRKS